MSIRSLAYILCICVAVCATYFTIIDIDPVFFYDFHSKHKRQVRFICKIKIRPPLFPEQDDEEGQRIA